MSKLTYKNIDIIDCFGIFGFLLWALTYLIRKTGLIFEYEFLKIFWNTPNIAFAWILTSFLKQLYRPSFSTAPLIKSSLTIKKYFLICFFVVFGSFINELIFLSFMNVNFDKFDLIATVIAQLIIFVFPIIFKEIK